MARNKSNPGRIGCNVLGNGYFAVGVVVFPLHTACRPVTFTTLLEAFTTQIDNLVLPLAGAVVLLLSSGAIVKMYNENSEKLVYETQRRQSGLMRGLCKRFEQPTNRILSSVVFVDSWRSVRLLYFLHVKQEIPPSRVGDIGGCIVMPSIMTSVVLVITTLLHGIETPQQLSRDICHHW